MTAAAMTEPATRSSMPPFVGTSGTATLETRFGRISVDQQRLLSFPAGMPGFPGCHHFQLERIAGSGFLLLQSLDEADLGFFVMPLVGPASLIRPADRIATCRLLALDPACTDYLAIVTARRSPDGIEFFANLRAPIVVDTRRRLGVQVVLPDAAYPLRHPVLPPC